MWTGAHRTRIPDRDGRIVPGLGCVDARVEEAADNGRLRSPRKVQHTTAAQAVWNLGRRSRGNAEAHKEGRAGKRMERCDGDHCARTKLSARPDTKVSIAGQSDGRPASLCNTADFFSVDVCADT